MSLTAGDVIERVLSESPQRLDRSVDTVKCGQPADPLTGVVTAFTASYAVLEQAAALGANLVITHEPVFYGHRDETDWLDSDPVYRAKRQLLAEAGIVVWRFHDHAHLQRPDAIITGMLERLEWGESVVSTDPWVVALEATPLSELTRLLESRLGARNIRVMAPDGLVCRRVGLSFGAAGGHAQIPLLGTSEVDVVICGEVNEWETPEYVRDAVALGRQQALVIIGHCSSEEAGIRHLTSHLRRLIPEVDVTFVEVGDPFSTV